MARKHPRARTWTLGALDRAQVYVLAFNHETQRWDVAYLHGSGAPLVTRAPTQTSGRRTARRRPGAEDRTAGAGGAGTP